MRNETLKGFVIQAWGRGAGRQPCPVSPETHVFFGYVGPHHLADHAIHGREQKQKAFIYPTLQAAHEAEQRFLKGTWQGKIEEILLCQCGCGKILKYAGNGRPPQFFSNACRQRFFRRKKRNETQQS